MTNESFNLPGPPGFRGLHPDLPVRTYRQHLPHLRQEGATYFVTFRLADSIPQTHLRALKRWRAVWERNHPEPRSDADWEALARWITRTTERWLDKGYGACELGLPQIATLMRESLLKFQNEHYLIPCHVVMPNHVHAIVTPLGRNELEDILRNIKGYVSRRVNEQLGRCGILWQQESYDRIIRDEEHLYRVIQYIGRNPGKAGLARSKWYRGIDPRWERAGWRWEQP